MTAATTRIRELNDALRLHSGSSEHGDWMITDGVRQRGMPFTIKAMHAVRDFSDFTPANDPHGEHDFGAFSLEGVRLNWKIDYFDRGSFNKGDEFGSNDPADEATTRRVLTVLLAEEY